MAAIRSFFEPLCTIFAACSSFITIRVLIQAVFPQEQKYVFEFFICSTSFFFQIFSLFYFFIFHFAVPSSSNTLLVTLTLLFHIPSPFITIFATLTLSFPFFVPLIAPLSLFFFAKCLSSSSRPFPSHAWFKSIA